jgi:two-component sensor histidine kinase
MLLGGPPAYVDMACIRRECRNRCSTGDGNRFAMSWTKSNGPPVQPPEHQGFGTTVTDTVVKQTLGVRSNLITRRWDLVWRLTCPAANVLEPAAE